MSRRNQVTSAGHNKACSIEEIHQTLRHCLCDNSCVWNMVSKQFKFKGSFADSSVLMKEKLLWSSIFVTLMANKIGGLQFGIYRNCQISSRVFHTAVAALPLTKANRSDFE